MDLLTLKSELKRLDITLSYVNNMLECEGPTGTLTPELLATIKRYKPALLDALLQYKEPIQAAPARDDSPLPDWDDLPDFRQIE